MWISLSCAAEPSESRSVKSDPRGGPGTCEDVAQRHLQRASRRRPDDKGQSFPSLLVFFNFLFFFLYCVCTDWIKIHDFVRPWLRVTFQTMCVFRFLFSMTSERWLFSTSTRFSSGTTCRSLSSTKASRKFCPSCPRQELTFAQTFS